jgi:FAD/FMN-containing dehydrogenase
MDVAVRGGGHDVMGRSVCEGGVLIDVALMNTISVSPDRNSARVEAGARAGQVNEALHAHARAAALGCNPGVGVAGLTLGGGLGWLLGRFGATCDNVVAVDLVTADGRQLRASERENADLFWGLRGGGGNFGIATAFEYRVHPVENVVGGYLAYAGRHAKEFLQVYRDVMASAPDELTVEIILLASAEPPAHAPVLIAGACYSGTLTDAQRVLAPLRSVGPPLVNVLREVPYARLTDTPPEMVHMLGAGPSSGSAETPVPVTGFNYWQGAGISNWTDAAIDSLIGCASTASPGWSIGLGHYMHGELCRVRDHGTPLLRREGSASYFFNMSWRDPDRSAEAMAWVDRSLTTMTPFSDAATYVNYLSSEADEGIAAAYGEHFTRLQALKRKFDPDNVLHFNRNIRPAP